MYEDGNIEIAIYRCNLERCAIELSTYEDYGYYFEEGNGIWASIKNTISHIVDYIGKLLTWLKNFITSTVSKLLEWTKKLLNMDNKKQNKKQDSTKDSTEISAKKLMQSTMIEWHDTFHDELTNLVRFLKDKEYDKIGEITIKDTPDSISMAKAEDEMTNLTLYIAILSDAQKKFSSIANHPVSNKVSAGINKAAKWLTGNKEPDNAAEQQKKLSLAASKYHQVLSKLVKNITTNINTYHKTLKEMQQKITEN